MSLKSGLCALNANFLQAELVKSPQLFLRLSWALDTTVY